MNGILYSPLISSLLILDELHNRQFVHWFDVNYLGVSTNIISTAGCTEKDCRGFLCNKLVDRAGCRVHEFNAFFLKRNPALLAIFA